MTRASREPTLSGNSLREGREQRSEERAKKKKLPNGFALAPWLSSMGIWIGS